MPSSKKRFVLYFSDCHSVRSLSPEQRGCLLSALYDYAVELTEEDRSPESALLQYPELEPEARMAFLFMGGSIRRDTQKWQEKREHCRARALERFQTADAQKNCSAM